MVNTSYAKGLLYSVIILTLTAFLSISFAHGEENFHEAEELIEAKIQCSELTVEQLENIGDYYMEQMHPGEAHTIMDERMGGEGSETLKQTHVNMAQNMYCNKNDDVTDNYGMMNYIFMNPFTNIVLSIISAIITLL
jgi:hypothetical protein